MGNFLENVAVSIKRTGSMRVVRFVRFGRVRLATTHLLSALFFFATAGLWFINNAQAGIASWAPPTIQILATGSGTGFTCAVADNKVYCWGNSNTYGQLGTEDTTTLAYTPRQVNDPNGVLVGKTITELAIARTGTVCVVASNVPYCWGRGQYGVLGNSTVADRYYPSAVTTTGVLANKKITDLSGGDGHMCVVASGAAYCWGTNGQGRVGDGTSTQRNAPVAVLTTGLLSGKTVTSIGAGAAFTCAIASGAAYCWGADTAGYLGNDATFANSTAVVAVNTSGVMSGKTMTALATGANHTCALASDSSAFCWGDGTSGALGNNASSSSGVPVRVYATGVLSGKTLTKISAGTGRACVIDSTNAAHCWGASQVGDGTASSRTVPVTITSTSTLSGKKVTEIANGANGSCYLTTENRLYCVTSGTGGYLGNNTTDVSSAPVEVLFSQAFNMSNYRVYTNANSITPGAPLAGINTPATLTQAGQDFRVRMGVKADTMIGNVSTGSAHSCGIVDGKAYCWGLNNSGQLGNNTTANSITPVAVDTSGVLAGKTIRSISAGSEHTCAITSDNLVYCWGLNGSGQLGNNSMTSSSVPVAVYTTGTLSGKTILSISAGGFHTCAIASDNQAYCWGSNAYGRLGNNSTVSSSVPVAVYTTGTLSGKTVLSISAGGEYTCAIASDNKAYCWGVNGSGQLGNNSLTQSSVPVAVSATSLTNAYSISTGNNHTCAITLTYQAYCWGSGSNGRLGNNSLTQSSVPVAVYTAGTLSGKTVRSISAGNGYTCATASDNQAYCWGYNNNGQLGNNSLSQSSVPVAVYTAGTLSGKTVRSISAGNGYTCAIASDNKAYCWGVNGSGQLGNGSTDTSQMPVGVSDGGSALLKKTIFSITNGYSHTCAIASDNQAYCWGQGVSGQLGNNSTTNSSIPVAVNTSGVLAGKTVLSISSGGSHTCAIASDNQAYCWGYNTYGQLGNNSTTNSSIPVAVNTSGVLSGKTIISITAGNYYTCAIASDNKTYCWGYNTYGQLGNNSTTDSSIPVAVNTSGVLAGKTVLSISAGINHACVIASDNQAYCWGYNAFGRLGNNSTTDSSIPVAVNTSGVLSGKTILSISVGGSHTCVIASDNQAYCWGYNNYGQLGDNSTASRFMPVAVNNSGELSGKTILSISVGGLHTCAIASDNQAYCWGYNAFGQRGDGWIDDSSIPIAVYTFSGVLSGKTILSITTGYAHTCAIASDNQAYCWGQGTNGQLGNNSAMTTSVMPTALYRQSMSGSVVYSNDNTYKLQYAQKTVSACSAQTGFIDVTASTSIAFKTNSSATHGASIGGIADDPVPTTDSIPQNYISAGGTFTNTLTIPAGQTGLWDFSLRDNTGNYGTSYCLRMVYGDGSVIENVSNYPEIQTVPRQSIEGAAYRFYRNADSTSPGEVLGLTNQPVNLTAPNQAFRLRTGLQGSLDIQNIAASKSDHTCAIASDNQAYCWGANGLGQLGNNSTEGSLVPVPVDTSGVLANKTILSISAGSYHTCAIASDNQAYCWGYNDYGQLGDDWYDNSSVPVPVDTSGVLSGKTLISISAGQHHTCAIASDNQAYCWGYNDYGQLGDGWLDASRVPVAVYTSGALSGKTILAISAGDQHTCAIASDNQAYCWGYNSDGQLGHSMLDTTLPAAVDTSGALSGKTLRSIAAGYYHTCAIASDNQAYCWGINSSGQSGSGLPSSIMWGPTAVDTSGALSGKTLRSIAAGGSHTCAIASDNQAYCWGSNTAGELGNNSTSPSTIPVQLSRIASSNTTSVAAQANMFLLQYALKTETTCSTQLTGFAAITNATPIAYSTNPSVSHGVSITTTANDPLASVNTTPLAYISSPGTFTNQSTITENTMGMWDFSLKDNGAPYNTSYCLRIAYSDGVAITTATMPELRTTLGVLSVGFVDATGVSLSSPTILFADTNVKTYAQTVSATLGTPTQKLRVYNDLVTNGWSVNLAATNGATALWNRSDNLAKYDYNDSAGDTDGGDTDLLGGALSVSPNLGMIISPDSCSTSGISKGIAVAFTESVIDNITLMSATNAAAAGCSFDLTGVGLSQSIPAGQPAGTYTLDVTATIVVQ